MNNKTYKFIVIIILIFVLTFTILLPLICIPIVGFNISIPLRGMSGSGEGGYGGSGGVIGKDCISQINSRAKEYVDIVNAAAEKYGQDPAFLLAQIEAESSFNPNATSDAGAQGIAQFIPGTFASMSRMYDIDGNKNGTENVWEPEDSIYAQAAYNKYIQETLKKNNIEPSMSNIIASYNAGEGAVIKYGGVPPYKETIKYVDKIINNLYPKYKRCLNESTISFNSSKKGDKIILHWTAGDYNTPYPNHYNYTILGDGTVVSGNADNISQHAANRNDSIGIAIAAGCDPSNSSIYPSDDVLGTKTFSGCGRPLKQIQYDKMIELTAQIAKENNIPVDKNHIMSHAEAAANRDYPKDLVEQVSRPNQAKCVDSADDVKANALGLPTCNYGPSSWSDGWPGGCQQSLMRWEYWEHEDQIRSDIKSKMN